MRSLCLLAFGCLTGLLVYTYDLKLRTRALEAEARELATSLQDESDFVAIMRAEVSYLSRPERVQELARKSLKLEPISPAQVVSWNAIISDSNAASQARAPTQPVKDGIGALIEKTVAPNAR